jgi:molecular chaperone DnaK
LGEKIDATKKKEIEDEIAKVKETLKGDDTDKIKAAADALNAKVQEFSAELYKQAAAKTEGQSAPEGAPEPEAKKEGEVVDADFEMVDKDKK